MKLKVGQYIVALVAVGGMIGFAYLAKITLRITPLWLLFFLLAIGGWPLIVAGLCKLIDGTAFGRRTIAEHRRQGAEAARRPETPSSSPSLPECERGTRKLD